MEQAGAEFFYVQISVRTNMFRPGIPDNLDSEEMEINYTKFIKIASNLFKLFITKIVTFSHFRQ